ncbi:hypothetical protein BBK82_25305 [Lentzea guizhouensis]|uniref:DUF1996 domain-containing protein n=2 Tax=Lentzea guizhouensis TaxID=1586287 RepID=A0A1B2HZ77_9PSEU|nr:hypothetical protein BBK82_25305 [Lentzea guizhouensis]
MYVSELDRTVSEPNTPGVVLRCGTNEKRHLNADNPVVSPGIPFGAHHTHEYVGNESANAMSTNTSLAQAPSTCEKDDRSTYYWPVLRLTDGTGHDVHADGGGLHGNTGEVLAPASVEVRYDGSPVSDVLPMPRFLRLITGDPSAYTNDYGPNTRARWGCADQPDRYTTKYPLCAPGVRTLRRYEFPSCWDGSNTDSASHRTHVVFALAGGTCPAKTFPVPRLHVTVGYDVPAGRPFAIDSFAEELRDPATDHGMFINVMPQAVMDELVKHLNRMR